MAFQNYMYSEKFTRKHVKIYCVTFSLNLLVHLSFLLSFCQTVCVLILKRQKKFTVGTRLLLCILGDFMYFLLNYV